MEKKINLVGLISFLDQVEPMFVDDSTVWLSIHGCLCRLTDIYFTRMSNMLPVLDDVVRESETDKES